MLTFYSKNKNRFKIPIRTLDRVWQSGITSDPEFGLILIHENRVLCPCNRATHLLFMLAKSSYASRMGVLLKEILF